MDIDNAIFVISEEYLGERLDKILSRHYSTIRSRSYFQKLLEEGHILVNDVPVKKRFVPKLGDEISVFFAATPELELIPENIPLDIIYEDEYLIAINKPIDMVVHPAPGNWSGTFVNALLHHCGVQEAVKSFSPNHLLRPGIVHRLDKDTTGVLLAAKTPLTQQKLIELFAARQVCKEYWAICIGNPGNGEIRAPIGRHPVDRKKMAVIESGKEAISICQTLKTNGVLSHVKVRLETGRTHQIRVHMKHKHSPILGDKVYGNTGVNSKFGVQRQMLHAGFLSFKHPITQQELRLEAALPQDFEKLLQAQF